MNKDWIVYIEWSFNNKADKTNTEHLRLSDEKINDYSDNPQKLGNKLLSELLKCTEVELKDKAFLKSVRIVEGWKFES